MPLNHPHPPTVHLSSSSQFCETAFIPFLFFPGNFFNCNILVVTGASCEGSVPPRGVLPPPPAPSHPGSAPGCPHRRRHFDFAVTLTAAAAFTEEARLVFQHQTEFPAALLNDAVPRTCTGQSIATHAGSPTAKDAQDA